jgi:hypothetical protein
VTSAIRRATRPPSRRLVQTRDKSGPIREGCVEVRTVVPQIDADNWSRVDPIRWALLQPIGPHFRAYTSDLWK